MSTQAASSRATWAQAPASVDDPYRGPSLLAVPIAFAIALAVPLGRAAALESGRLQLVTVVAVAAAISFALPARWWWLRLATAGAAWTVIETDQGSTVAGWVLGGLLLASWIGLRRPPLPLVPRPGPGATGPALVLTAVAAWQATTETATWQVTVPLVLAAAMPFLATVAGGAIDRRSARIGDAVARPVAALGYSALGLAVVVVPGMVQRALRFDVLGTRPGWLARERGPVHASRPWATDPVPGGGRAPFAPRLAGVGVGVAVLLVATVVLDPFGGRYDASGDRLLGPSAAGAVADDWYQEYREDIAWILDERVALDPFEVYRLLDVETRHVTIRDGRRDTWTPPPCDCARLTVWLYGGDGAFGFEQRDDHTVASELARVALDHGIVLDVHNRGVPGQLHWRSALRFAWDLTTEPPPDLVVFYEGAEELDAARTLVERGLGDVRAPYEPFIEDLYDDVARVGARPDPPAGTEYLGWPTVGPDAADDPGELAAERYRRSRQLSADTAAGAGIAVRYAWQPVDGADRRRAEASAAARARLGAGVIDLGDALEGHDGRTVEGVHLDETGARLVAESLFDALRPDLTDLAAAEEAAR